MDRCTRTNTQYPLTLSTVGYKMYRFFWCVASVLMVLRVSFYIHFPFKVQHKIKGKIFIEIVVIVMCMCVCVKECKYAFGLVNIFGVLKVVFIFRSLYCRFLWLSWTLLLLNYLLKWTRDKIVAQKHSPPHGPIGPVNNFIPPSCNNWSCSSPNPFLGLTECLLHRNLLQFSIGFDDVVMFSVRTVFIVPCFVFSVLLLSSTFFSHSISICRCYECNKMSC